MAISTTPGDQPLLFKKRSYTDKYVGYDKMDKYYAGSDVLVYFNTVWVPEITSIQFTAGPKDAPIYSYAHENFNAVTKGTFIVTGQITMNFVETGYLNKVFRTVWNDVLDKSYFTNTYDSVVDKDRFDRSVDALLADNRRNLTFRDVEQAKKVLKQRIWGLKTNSMSQDKYMYRPDQLTASKSFIDIDAAGREVWRSIPPINLIIIYGNPKGKHEVKKLTDIRLLEYGQTIQNDGTPIQEVYSFIARDMDNPEEISGVSPLGANDNQLNIDAVSLTKMMADSLFSFISRDTSFKVHYDSKYLYEKDSYTLVESKEFGKYAYQGKDSLSLSVLHGFTFPIDFMATNKIGPFGETTEKDMESIRSKTLTRMLDNQRDITAQKFYQRDPDGLLSNNTLLDSDLLAYTAAVLDRISYINPYYTAYNTKFISRFLPKDEDIIEAGILNVPIVKKSEFTMKTGMEDKLTYPLLVMEKMLVNADDPDAREFNTIVNENFHSSVFIDSSATATIVRASGQNYPYRSFELLRANTEVHRTDISSGQLRMISILNAGLDTLPKPAGTDSDDISKIRSTYSIPEDYAREGIILYDPAGKPMPNGIKPITEISAGADYYLQYRDQDGIAHTEFPLPEGLRGKTDIECLVFVDNNFSYYPGGITKGSVWFNFNVNTTNNTFTVYLYNVPKVITTETLIRVVLVDQSLTSLENNKSYFTSSRYTKYKHNYFINHELNVYRKAENSYLLEKVKELSASLSERILGTRLAASVAMPVYSLIESPFTGNIVRQYINRIVAYTKGFQYKFDFQYFVDAFIADLQASRQTKFGTQTATRKFANIDVDLIRQTFRDRFLKMYDGYYTSGSIQINLLGSNRRTVLITGEFTSPPTTFISEALKSSTKQFAKASNLLTLNYSVIDIDAKGSRTLVGGGLSMGMVGLRSAYLYNMLHESTLTNSLIEHTHPTNKGVNTILLGANNIYSIPISTEGTEFDTIDNILLDYLPESGRISIKGVMHKEQYETPVGTVGTSGIVEGNILYLNKYSPDSKRSRYELISYFKSKDNPSDFIRYISRDNLIRLLNQPISGRPYSQTADVFKLMFGTTGIDGIYGTDSDPDGLLDMTIVDRRTKSLLYFKSILHALVELKHTVAITKIIGATEWPALITIL